MGIPVSLVLIAAGAILAFAVTGSPTSGLDLHTVGWILIATGLLGLLLSLIMWDSWAGGGFWRRGPQPAGRAPVRRRVVREDEETRPY